MVTNEIRNKTINLFRKYINDDITKSNLITELYNIEIELEYPKTFSEKDLWFKFTKDDTIATTITNLSINEHDINMNFYKEQIKQAISNPEEFTIHFS